MFDLPTITRAERREYTKFRKFLILNGYIMMQESVYCKLALNLTAINIINDSVRKNKPASGLVQMITLTEKQYSSIQFIVGESKSDTIDSDERLIVL